MLGMSSLQYHENWMNILRQSALGPPSCFGSTNYGLLQSSPEWKTIPSSAMSSTRSLPSLDNGGKLPSLPFLRDFVDARSLARPRQRPNTDTSFQLCRDDDFQIMFRCLKLKMLLLKDKNIFRPNNIAFRLIADDILNRHVQMTCQEHYFFGREIC